MPVSFGIGRHQHTDRALVMRRATPPLGILDLHQQLANLVDVVMADLVAQQVFDDLLFGLDRAMNGRGQPGNTQEPGRGFLNAVLAGT